MRCRYYVDGGKARPAALLAIGEAHAHEARRIRGAWLERSSFKGGMSALPPGETRQFSVSFEEFHIGLQFTQGEQPVAVASVLPGSEAARCISLAQLADPATGPVVVAVEGCSTREASLAEVQRALRKAGRPVRITLEVRGDEPAVQTRSEEEYHAAVNGGRCSRIKELAAKRMRARREGPAPPPPAAPSPPPGGGGGGEGGESGDDG
ncbi:hypothetical protein T484DRAFT_2836766 [Baffinella frigidus]|nr:hypothetical protein T484DRAFT_2836766 [Cryptophyta sp. CCMP2293]